MRTLMLILLTLISLITGSAKHLEVTVDRVEDGIVTVEVWYGDETEYVDIPVYEFNNAVKDSDKLSVYKVYDSGNCLILYDNGTDNADDDILFAIM